jgi:hypothetical protein
MSPASRLSQTLRFIFKNPSRMIAVVRSVEWANRSRLLSGRSAGSHQIPELPDIRHSVAFD